MRRHDVASTSISRHYDVMCLLGCNRSVTKNLRHFVLFYLSRATSWTHRSSDASDVKIEIYTESIYLERSIEIDHSHNCIKIARTLNYPGVNNKVYYSSILTSDASKGRRVESNFSKASFPLHFGSTQSKYLYCYNEGLMED